MGVYSRKNKRDGKTYHFIRYTLLDGRRKKEKVGTRKKAADDLLEQRRTEIRQGTYVEPSAELEPDPTFGEFAERFLREHPGQRRSNHYPATVKRLVEHFGDRLLREIARADLDAYRVKLQSEKAKNRQRPLSDTTVLKLLRVLGRMFKVAVRWGLLEVNPAADLEKPAPAKSKTRYLSRDEVESLESATPPWLRPMVMLAVATGMRLKEITELRWDDIDLASGFLYVAQNTKTGTRAVPLTQAARGILKGQVRRLRCAYVFTDLAGEPYTTVKRRDEISKATRAAMRAAGVEAASFHTLRHTAAAWMVQGGVSLYEVQKVLGHSTPVMTQRYAHLAPEHLRGAAKALDAALQAGTPQTSRL